MANLIGEKADGRNIVYAPALGNWGDALIHKGILQFLDHYKFRYTTIMRPKIDAIRESLVGTNINLQDSVLLNCGGGSWCRNFHGTRDFVNRNWSLFSETIVMPSTYELEMITQAGDRVTYLSRDKERSLSTVPQATFRHDMALFLQLPEELPVVPEIENGYFMREDKERNGAAHSFKSSFDISLLGNQRSKITPFFKILNGYKHITTDRMHVAIAGAMLDKQVTLYSSDYFKAPAVFRSSLADKFPNVSLAEW